ncbi:MAG: YbhB/YbcL family Raf kinase inhibitor-like protein [Legionella sp.]|uniref:YbhB/YbcL family Raf kinase inhibitor-like protein n=1 Tax=Legionella sp. TaxID=459 RepID=UPI0039E346E3
MKKIALVLFLYLVHTHVFATEPFSLDSTAFKLNTMIPAQYSCDGVNQSPPLAWHSIPEKTQSFVLIMQDPNGPNGVWTHWILFNIPANVRQLDAGSPTPQGATNGKNSWGGLGYRGPCPPLGAHSYVFKLYAVDRVLTLGEGATADTILNTITGHVLGSAELVGLYQK